MIIDSSCLFLSNENPISSRSGLRFFFWKVVRILDTSSEGSPAPSNRAKRECCPFRSLRSSCAISIGSSGGYSDGSFIVDLQPRQEIPLLTRGVRIPLLTRRVRIPLANARGTMISMVFSERLVSLRLFQYPQSPVPLRLGSHTWDRRVRKSLLSRYQSESHHSCGRSDS